MVDPNTRQGKRTPVTLKIKFKSETLEQFIERYAVDVSQGGIFIRTKEPLAVGTQMKFEFQLRDASPLIAGEGTVVWTRENDPSRPAIAPGMGVRFDRLAEGSQGVLEKILAEKAKQAPQRGGTSEGTTKPPMFADSPTRVAPAPVQEALLGNRSGRTRADSEQTPLPKPMPFHSDADEFGAEAFEEATKVRALDELVAQTAEAPQDELAARRGPAGRADSTSPLADPPAPDDRMRTVPDRDSAPGLPSPPEPSGRTGKLLDTSPSPRQAGITTPPGLQPVDSQARTRLGLEPAKAPTMPPRYEQTERVQAPRAVAAEQAPLQEHKRPSSAPIIIGILVVVAAAMAAVWFFVLREPAVEDIAKNGTGSGSAKKTPVGSGGSAVAMTGSGSAGSAVADVGSGSGGGSGASAPKGPTVDTEIASNVAKATVTIIDGDQTGPAPFKAKLEKDKMYKARVEAPGYVKAELDVKGGQDKITAKLVAKTRTISVASEPPGAAIYVDNAPTGKVTPADVDLTTAQAAKPKLHIQLRKSGFRPIDQMIDAAAAGWTDDDAKMTFKVDTRLSVMIVINNNNNNNNHNNGSGSGAGSADRGSGSGSAEPNAGSGSEHSGTGSGGTGTGSGSGGGTGGGSATSTKPAGAGSGEPEPDWSKRN